MSDDGSIGVEGVGVVDGVTGAGGVAAGVTGGVAAGVTGGAGAGVTGGAGAGVAGAGGAGAGVTGGVGAGVAGAGGAGVASGVAGGVGAGVASAGGATGWAAKAFAACSCCKKACASSSDAQFTPRALIAITSCDSRGTGVASAGRLGVASVDVGSSTAGGVGLAAAGAGAVHGTFWPAALVPKNMVCGVGTMVTGLGFAGAVAASITAGAALVSGAGGVTPDGFTGAGGITGT